MPIYLCKTINSAGKTNEFVREALSKDILIRELTKEDVTPILIKETDIAPGKKAKKKKYKSASLIEFCNTLMLLLTSGLTLKDSLDVAQTIYLKGEVNEMIVSLLEEIKKGHSFHAALEKYEASFPPIFTGFVKIGEKLGSLDSAFKRLSEYLVEEKKLKDKLISSLIYPIMVFGLAIIGVTVIIFLVIPKFMGIYDNLGIEAPEHLTSVLTIFNLTLTIFGGILLSIILMIPFLLFMRKKNMSFAEKLDSFFLKVPFIGKMTYLKENLNFIYAMENLTESGYTVEDALKESSKVVSNNAIRAAILRARQRIVKGDDLSKAFFDEPVFSKRLGRWIAIGERSGHIEKVFSQLRMYYQGEIEKWSSRFLDQIQPILILFVGVIILFMILFFIVPMFSIYGDML